MDTTHSQNSAAQTAEPKSDKTDAFLHAALQVKVAVYAKGTAAGLGVIPQKLPMLQKLYKVIGEDALKAKIKKRIDEAISNAQVVYGIDEEAITDAVTTCLQEIQTGKTEMVTRKVAQGDLPIPGTPMHLEYVLNPDNLPMAKVEDVAPTSDKVWLHVVRAGDVLVHLVPAEEGKPGRSVLGADLPPPKLDNSAHLTGIMGSNTEIEGSTLVATCEGAYEENALGQVRVVPEIVIDNVDEMSGSVPEAGTSQASVLVWGDVKKPYVLHTSELAFVGMGDSGGIVEKLAHVVANHLVVNGTIQGVIETGKRDQRPAVDVASLCVADEIDGALVQAGTLLVRGDCRVAKLDVDEWVRIDGDVLGSTVVCRQMLNIAGDLGSEEGGSHTRIVVPLNDGSSRKIHRLELSAASKAKDLAELTEKLQALENENVKRAKPNPYWSDLLAGNFRQPQTAFEGQTLRQFMDMKNREKELRRKMESLRTTILNLQAKREEIAELQDAGQGIVMRVGGQFYLDAAIDVMCGVGEDDLDVLVHYTHDGTRVENQTLQKLQQHLSRQASEYLQSHEAFVGERREAIDKMFEGRENRPTGPVVAHQNFELDFEWADDDDTKAALQASPLLMKFTACVNSRELRKMIIHAHVTLRKVQAGVEINVTRNGPRPVFTVGGIGARWQKWQDDPEALARLDGLSIRGLSARALLMGEPLPESEHEATGSTADET